jgi:hypothetical protein
MQYALSFFATTNSFSATFEVPLKDGARGKAVADTSGNGGKKVRRSANAYAMAMAEADAEAAAQDDAYDFYLQ